MPDSSIASSSILASQLNFKIEDDEAQGGDGRIIINKRGKRREEKKKNKSPRGMKSSKWNMLIADELASGGGHEARPSS